MPHCARKIACGFKKRAKITPKLLSLAQAIIDLNLRNYVYFSRGIMPQAVAITASQDSATERVPNVLWVRARGLFLSKARKPDCAPFLSCSLFVLDGK
jgi:hypothetical protein